jgi:hypothetical protein
MNSQNETYRNSLSFLIALINCSSVVLCAQQRPTMTIDLNKVGQPGKSAVFSEVNDVNLLPQAVINEFRGGIVSPEEDFQATDAVDGKRLPFRRLVIAAVAKNYCLVHYERGGIRHSWMITLFKLSSGKAELVWASIAQPRTNLNFRELKAVVASGKLRDDPGHKYW